MALWCARYIIKFCIKSYLILAVLGTIYLMSQQNTLTNLSVQNCPLKSSRGPLTPSLVYKSLANKNLCHNITLPPSLLLTSNDLQELRSSSPVTFDLYLYAAFSDRRAGVISSTVRILGMIHRDEVTLLNHTSCLYWLEDKLHPLLAPATWRVMWGYNVPYHSVMITCQSADHVTVVPSHVTLTDGGCSAVLTNILEVVPSPDNIPINAHSLSSVAVCTKVLYGRLDPVRLTEWVELNHILGASNIYLYNTSVTGTANHVLNYYQQKRMITLIQHPFPMLAGRRIGKLGFPTPNYHQDWEFEILSINDCLYRAQEPYIVNIDLDEVLYISNYSTYAEYIEKDANTNHPRGASLVFKTGMYSDEFGSDPDPAIPRYLHTMTHNTRTGIDFESPKSIIRRLRCLVAGHHVCRAALPGHHRWDFVAADEGHVRHYRRKCNLTGKPQKCADLLKHPIRDKALEKYMNVLAARVRHVLGKFNLVDGELR